jgi:hypothetical protein
MPAAIHGNGFQRLSPKTASTSFGVRDSLIHVQTFRSTLQRNG